MAAPLRLSQLRRLQRASKKLLRSLTIRSAAVERDAAGTKLTLSHKHSNSATLETGLGEVQIFQVELPAAAGSPPMHVVAANGSTVQASNGVLAMAAPRSPPSMAPGALGDDHGGDPERSYRRFTSLISSAATLPELHDLVQANAASLNAINVSLALHRLAKLYRKYFDQRERRQLYTDATRAHAWASFVEPSLQVCTHPLCHLSQAALCFGTEARLSVRWCRWRSGGCSTFRAFQPARWRLPTPFP